MRDSDIEGAPDWFVQMTSGFNGDLPAGARPIVAELRDGDLMFGGASVSMAEATPEVVAWVMEGLQDQVIERRGSAWPRCPVHGTHPLEPAGPGWVCPATPDSPYPYGSIGETVPPPEPARADGEVRWFLASRGWGIVAHHEGDLFVLHTQIQMSGRRELVEGELVDYEIAPHKQGRLRQVAYVRPRSTDRS